MIATEFGEVVNQQSKRLPKDERFELTSQFKRAANSIAFNMAEGYGGSDKQFHHYLGNAWRRAHDYIACSSKVWLRNYISTEEDEENRRLITELSR